MPPNDLVLPDTGSEMAWLLLVSLFGTRYWVDRRMPRLCGKVNQGISTRHTISYDLVAHWELTETIKIISPVMAMMNRSPFILHLRAKFICRDSKSSRKSSECLFFRTDAPYRYFRTDAPYSYRMSSKVQKRLSSSPKMNATLSLSTDGLTPRKEKL